LDTIYQVSIRTTEEDAKSVEHQTTRGFEVQSVTASPGAAAPRLGEARFVDPVTITVATTLSLLAVRLTNHWLKRSERGVQIDLRTTPPTVSLIAGVPSGVLVVIDKDGKPTIRSEKYDAPENLLPVLAGLFGAGAAGV
jgi:hypothetical protein